MSTGDGRVLLPDGRVVLVFRDPEGAMLFSGLVGRRGSDGRLYQEGRTWGYDIAAPDTETAARLIAAHVDAGQGTRPDSFSAGIAIAGEDDPDAY